MRFHFYYLFIAILLFGIFLPVECRGRRKKRPHGGNTGGGGKGTKVQIINIFRLRTRNSLKVNQWFSVRLTALGMIRCTDRASMKPGDRSKPESLTAEVLVTRNAKSRRERSISSENIDTRSTAVPTSGQPLSCALNGIKKLRGLEILRIIGGTKKRH